MTNGLIKDCKAAGCGFHCCGFGADGHIIVMKSEEAEVLKSKHLVRTGDESNGSVKVKCVAKNKASCDGGYKPIQCRSYPLYKRGDEWERSERCPLSDQQVVGHLSSVVTIFSKEDADFLRSQKTTMYRGLSDVYGRTFGLEVEFGDVKKSAVKLPSGWKWSKEEKSIVNSNGKKSTPTGERGGELNTAPLNVCLSDFRTLRKVIGGCFDAGGVMMWNTGFDGHLWVGDVGLDGLKRIFALGFYVSPLINEVFRLGEWFGVEHLVPTPTFEFNERVQRAESIESFRNIFANSSNRGHYRFQVNVMSYFTTETVEFRIFNSTRKFRETLETIRFMYRFVDFALTADEAEFRRIKTVDDFKRVFGLVKEMPKSHPPLIFAESHKEATRSIARAFPLSRKIITAVQEAAGDAVVMVNPLMYQAEMALFGKKRLTIVNNSPFNDVLKRLAVDGDEIVYSDRFEFLNGYDDGTPERRVSLFMWFSRVQKFNVDTDYGMNEFVAHVGAIEESLEKGAEWSRMLVKVLNGSRYVEGCLVDAMMVADSDVVVYQQESNTKANSAYTALKRYSEYQHHFGRQEMTYKDVYGGISAAGKRLMVVSRNQFLPMNVAAKDLDVILYSNFSELQGIRSAVDKAAGLTTVIPSDDFDLNGREVVVREVKPTMFSLLQERFVKKVTKFKQPRICFVVMCDDVVLGAFGFDYDKSERHSLFLLSDFCTNNNVTLLSKFILMVIKTREVKRLVERKLVEAVKDAYTKVYTTMPVSMKYRGEFDKVGGDGKALVYRFDFGSGEGIKEAVMKWEKKKEKRNVK